jgi:hypothetical protein
MIAGDDGWDDPVALPEDDDPAIVTAPAPPPVPEPPLATASAHAAPRAGGPGPSRAVRFAGGGVGVAAIVVGVVLLSGGSSSSSHHPAKTLIRPPATGTLTEAQFVSEANTICSASLSQATSDETGGNLQAAAADFLAMNGKLEALDAPAQDAGPLKRYTGAVTDALNALQANNGAEFETDLQTINTLGQQLQSPACAGAGT